jgi:hypothetical protein
MAIFEVPLERRLQPLRKARLDIAEAGDRPAYSTGHGTSVGWATMMPTSGGDWVEPDAG